MGNRVIVSTDREVKRARAQGRLARKKGIDKEECKYSPINQMHLRSWWLAEWHDLDMVLTS